MYGYGHMGGFGYGFGFLFEIVFWGLIIWGVVALLRHHRGGGCCGVMGGHNHNSQGGESAVDILKKRYAKGEIGKEDFERMKKELE